MPRRRKILWSVLGALVLLFAVVGLYLRFFDWNRLKPTLAEMTERRTGEALHIDGDLDLDLGWRPRVRAERIRYGRLLDLRLFEAQLSLWSLLGGTIDFPVLRLVDGKVLASAEALPDRPRQGAEEPRKPAEKRRRPAVRIGRLSLRDVSVTVPRRDAAPVVLVVEDVQLHALPGSDRAVVYGEARLQDQVLLLSGALDGYSRFSDRKAHAFRVASRLGGLLVEGRGSLRMPLRLEGDVRVRGSGIGEIAAAAGVPVSAEVPELRLDAALTLVSRRLEATGIDFRLGESQVEGRAAVDLAGKVPKLEVALVAGRLRPRDFTGLLPRKAARELPVSRAGRAEGGRVLSPAPLPLAMLRKVDVDADVRVRRFDGDGAAELLRSAHAVLRLSGGELRLAPFEVKAAGGEVESELVMRVDGDGTATLDLQTRLARLDLGRLAEPFVEETPVGDGSVARVDVRELLVGRIGGRVRLESRFSSLRELAAKLDGRIRLALEDGELSSVVVEALGFDVTEAIGALLAEGKTIDLHCVVADIRVDDGVVNPNVILVATEDSNIWVDGTVDLGKEALDLELRTIPKDFSIGSLRGPIRLSGSFREPRLDLGGAEAAARLTAAAILGAVVTPAAAALAFVEPGLGKEGQCARFQRTIAAFAH
jgi:uncharacterized protein involved in outer membrane biogenesis